MTITITNTPKSIEYDGINCQLWEGQSDTGLKAHLLVALVVVEGNNTLQLQEELAKSKLPSKDIEAYGLRLINHKAY